MIVYLGIYVTFIPVSNYLEPPTISNGANRTLDVEEGDDVPLHCDANGDPMPLAVTWKKMVKYYNRTIQRRAFLLQTSS